MLLDALKTKTKLYGDRSFAAWASRLWNALPVVFRYRDRYLILAEIGQYNHQSLSVGILDRNRLIYWSKMVKTETTYVAEIDRKTSGKTLQHSHVARKQLCNGIVQ